MSVIRDIGKNSDEYNVVQNKLREIFELCFQYHVDAGELQMIVGRQFGVKLEMLEGSQIDEVRQWVISNWFRIFSILEPIRHQQLLDAEANDYSKWFREMEKQHKIEPVYGW